MANALNLSDLYQAANITLGAEDFAARQTAFVALGTSLNKKRIIDLVRMYFGWWEKADDYEWFREGFGADPRFSLQANRREASLLAGGLLLKALKSGEAFAGLVVLAASLSRQRAATVPGIDLSVFEMEFKNVAAKVARPRRYSSEFKRLGKTSATSDTMVAGGTQISMGVEVQRALDEVHAATQAGFSETQIVLKQMANDLSEARQEIEMLWWLTGGWSRKLDQPFSILGIPLGAVAAGFDLADLSLTTHGPYAAEAMLTRALSLTKKSKKSATLAEVGDSPSAQQFSRLAVPSHVTEYPDICPLSAALAKSSEIGAGLAWHQSFEKSAHVKPDASLTPAEIAVQAMRERLILSNL